MTAHTDADRAREVATIRAQWVYATVQRNIDHWDGVEPPAEQLVEWENKAFRDWRRRHPALNALLPTHLPEASA